MPDPARPPKYRHYKPKNLAVVRINGRDIYLGRYDSPESWEKYHRTLAEWHSTGIEPTPAPQGEGRGATEEQSAVLTVSQVAAGFWKHAQGYYRRANGEPTGEIEGYRQTLRPLRQLYGSTPTAEFGPKALKAVRQSMIDAGLCRKTINQRIRRIVHVFAWAVENELIPGSVHHSLKAVRGLQRGRSAAKEREPIRPVPDEVVNATLPHVNSRVAAMIELQRLSGMRPGEVCIMRTCDLDRSGPIWTYTPREHKTEHHGHARTVYLGPRAQEVVKPWLKADPEAFLFSPADVMRETWAARRAARKTPMTPSQRARRRKESPRSAPGERYTTHSYYYVIRRACDKAGIDLWHPHQLRHSHATELRKRFGLETARIILGHTSPVVTEIYAEIDREQALSVVREIG